MSKRTPRWVRRTHLLRADEYICSACGAVCAKPYKVCPSCGRELAGTDYLPTWVDEAEMLSVILEDDD